MKFLVDKVDTSIGKEFIKKHHYSQGCHNGPITFGLWDSEKQLVGVAAFANPSSEAVRAQVFGPQYKSQVTELHRFVTLDGLPANTESWFLARVMRQLPDWRETHTWAVVSYADPAEGHLGFLYQATNFIYTGQGSSATFYRTPEGKLKHPRNNGVNITRADAEKLGWTPERRPGKHRYIGLIGTTAERRLIRRKLLLPEKAYPKNNETS